MRDDLFLVDAVLLASDSELSKLENIPDRLKVAYFVEKLFIIPSCERPASPNMRHGSTAAPVVHAKQAHCAG